MMKFIIPSHFRRDLICNMPRAKAKYKLQTCIVVVIKDSSYPKNTLAWIWIINWVAWFPLTSDNYARGWGFS